MAIASYTKVKDHNNALMAIIKGTRAVTGSRQNNGLRPTVMFRPYARLNRLLPLNDNDKEAIDVNLLVLMFTSLFQYSFISTSPFRNILLSPHFNSSVGFHCLHAIVVDTPSNNFINRMNGNSTCFN